MNKKRTRTILGLFCMLVFCGGIYFAAEELVSAKEVYSSEIFQTKDFVMEYEEGILFTGQAPATFSMREKIGGDFRMSFTAAADKSVLTFNDGEIEVPVFFAKNGNQLTINVEEVSQTLSMGKDGKITVHLAADEGKLTVSTGDKFSEFTFPKFDFTTYQTHYSVTEHSGGAAEICVHSINGTVLNKPRVHRTEKQLYMNVSHDGVVGVDYKLERPVLYDVRNGISDDVRITVTKDGSEILKNTTWDKGLSFPTETAGEYEVLLTTDGLEKEYCINVRETISESSIHIKEKFPFKEIGVGSKITVPRVFLENELYGKTLQETQCIVKLNGKRVHTSVGSERKEPFAFSEEGTYEFDFYSVEPYLKDTYSFSVKVTKDLPALIYEYEDSSAAKGAVFELPRASICLGNKELETKTIVHFPSGKAVSNDVILSEAGLYSIDFKATDKKQVYTYSYDYLVDEKIHQTENSAEYGAWDEGYFDEPVNGLLVEMSNGSTYEFGNIVDLSDNDKPYARLMKFYILPYEQGKADFKDLEIVLTDAYDENNYVTLNFKDNSEDYGMTYVTGRASNQNDNIGLRWTNKEKYAIHKNNVYGYQGTLGFAGNENINMGAGYINTAFDLGYDNTTQIVYGTHAWLGGNGDHRIVTRLADTTLYKEAFKGFTTGEVRVSIKAKNFSSSKGRLLITDLDGQDLTQLVVKDTTPPIITVDTKGYAEDNLPMAVVGEKYPVFLGNAVDAQSGKQDIDVSVYYTRNSRKYNVSLQNNTFVPREEGAYVIEYSAQDFYRNKAVKQLVVQAGKEVPMEITLGKKVESAFTGEKIAVADYQCAGGSGLIQLESLTVKNSKGEECKLKSGKFQPEKEGKYTVCYNFKDYLGAEKQVDYVIDITDSKDPILNSEPVLPMAFLNGGTYILPDMNAQDYSTGKRKEVKAEIWVTDAKGKKRIEKGQYQAMGETGTDATVTYLFKTANGELQKDYTVPIRNLYVGEVNSKLFNLSGLIIPSNGTIVTKESNEHYFVDAKQNETFYFANDLLADVFKFEFNVGYSNNGTVTGQQLEKVRITLTDSEKRSEQVYVDIEKSPENDQKSLLSVNGGTKYVVDGSFLQNTNYTFTVQYNGEIQSIMDGKDLKVEVEKYANGKKFKGFSSGTLYCTVDMIGVQGNGALLEVISLNGQPFIAGDMKDKIAPSFNLTSSMKVCYSVGDKVKIPKAIVSDVISTSSHVKLSVQAPDQEYVKTSDGVELKQVDAKEYKIKLDEIGIYLITYTVWDDNGGAPSTISRTLNVMDEEAPIIKTSKKSLSTKKGKSLNVDIFEVTDNYDEKDIKIHLYVLNKEGKLVAVEGSKFKFDKAGEYRLIAVAYDAAGNMAHKEVPVTVGGAK